jgi:hypothetical protein
MIQQVKVKSMSASIKRVDAETVVSITMRCSASPAELALIFDMKAPLVATFESLQVPLFDRDLVGAAKKA